MKYFFNFFRSHYDDHSTPRKSSLQREVITRKSKISPPPKTYTAQQEINNLGWKKILVSSQKKLKLVEQNLDHELTKAENLANENRSALQSFIEIRSELVNINLKVFNKKELFI